MSQNFDCSHMKTESLSQFVEINYPTLEVQEGSNFDKLILDIRSYICAHKLCKKYYKRSHHRISSFIWNKIISTKGKNYIHLIENFAKRITRQHHSVLNKHGLSSSLNKKITYKNSKTGNTVDARKYPKIENRCIYCNNSKLKGKKHVHFVKENNSQIETRIIKIPIEQVFTKIEEISEMNAIKIYNTHNNKTSGPVDKKQNNIRMTYGDINYLGGNKALLYFDRGFNNKQTFTNSVHSLKLQPKHLDIIILDDIVFTSQCACRSSSEHSRIFPHYRVTCAAGLTCPARLNSYEKISFARSKNASTEAFTTARSMLIRDWR